jgi:sulfur-carrier protein adenylyltransferase/sulfurtransferase
LAYFFLLFFTIRNMQEFIDLQLEDYQRYARHLALPDFEELHQQKLKNARVLVIGAGGLGAPLLLYLAAAGVGTIGIVEYDQVDISNLQRQILYQTADIGRPKIEVARERLLALNPRIKVVAHAQALDLGNALDLIGQYDLVADGSDNFPTRYLVNDACVLAKKPLVYAAIFRYEGQVSVFNAMTKDGRLGPNYRNLYPQAPPPGSVPTCAEGGVLGVLPGIIGAMQANEVIKLITGLGEPLIGKLFLFDAASMLTRSLKIQWEQAFQVEKLAPLAAYCEPVSTGTVRSITVTELLSWQRENRSFQLIDVREAHEYARDNRGGLHLPVGEILQKTEFIARDRPVVIHCQSGKRSQKAIAQLQAEGSWDNLYSLEGGLSAWAKGV